MIAVQPDTDLAVPLNAAFDQARQTREWIQLPPGPQRCGPLDATMMTEGLTILANGCELLADADQQVFLDMTGAQRPNIQGLRIRPYETARPLTAVAWMGDETNRVVRGGVFDQPDIDLPTLCPAFVVFAAIGMTMREPDITQRHNGDSFQGDYSEQNCGFYASFANDWNIPSPNVRTTPAGAIALNIHGGRIRDLSQEWSNNVSAVLRTVGQSFFKGTAFESSGPAGLVVARWCEGNGYEGIRLQDPYGVGQMVKHYIVVQGFNGNQQFELPFFSVVRSDGAFIGFHPDAEAGEGKLDYGVLTGPNVGGQPSPAAPFIAPTNLQSQYTGMFTRSRIQCQDLGVILPGAIDDLGQLSHVASVVYTPQAGNPPVGPPPPDPEPGDYATLDPAYKSAHFTVDGNAATYDDTDVHGLVRATRSIGTRDVYFEMTANPSATGSVVVLGLIGAGEGVDNYVGGYNPGCGIGCATDTNQFFHAGYAAAGTAPVFAGVTFGFAVKGATGEVWVLGPNGYVGGGDPVAGTNPTFTRAQGQQVLDLYPAISGYNDTGTHYGNFGAAAYARTPPAGFEAL